MVMACRFFSLSAVAAVVALQSLGVRRNLLAAAEIIILLVPTACLISQRTGWIHALSRIMRFRTRRMVT